MFPGNSGPQRAGSRQGVQTGKIWVVPHVRSASLHTNVTSCQGSATTSKCPLWRHNAMLAAGQLDAATPGHALKGTVGMHVHTGMHAHAHACTHANACTHAHAHTHTVTHAHEGLIYAPTCALLLQPEKQQDRNVQSCFMYFLKIGYDTPTSGNLKAACRMKG